MTTNNEEYLTLTKKESNFFETDYWGIKIDYRLDNDNRHIILDIRNDKKEIEDKNFAITVKLDIKKIKGLLDIICAETGY